MAGKIRRKTVASRVIFDAETVRLKGRGLAPLIVIRITEYESKEADEGAAPEDG
jgi:hypothetical protein